MRTGINYSVFSSFAIPLSLLLEVASEQKVTIRSGDILLIRTGWMLEYNKLNQEQKDALGGREVRTSCGVEASREAIRWHWESAFAAVASDTVAYEVWPPTKPWGVSMHEVGPLSYNSSFWQEIIRANVCCSRSF